MIVRMSRTPLGGYTDSAASREMGLKFFLQTMFSSAMGPVQVPRAGNRISRAVSKNYSTGLVLLRISLNINNENTSIRVEGTRLDAAAPL